MELKITADFILSTMNNSTGNGLNNERNTYLSCDYENSHWFDLAFKTSGIRYTRSEIEWSETQVECYYEFRFLDMLDMAEHFEKTIEVLLWTDNNKTTHNNWIRYNKINKIKKG